MNNDIFKLTVSNYTSALLGGGFSGSLVAANLLRTATVPLLLR
jgi:hypothetical protein